MNVVRIFDNGDGTCRVKRVESFNSAEPILAPEIARKNYDYQLPVCAERYYAWDGSNVVEASQQIKDAVDAAIAAEQEQIKEDTATASAGLSYIKALVKVINLRLPAGQKISAQEMKQAIKDEL